MIKCPKCGESHDDAPLTCSGYFCGGCQMNMAQESAEKIFGKDEYYQADMDGSINVVNRKEKP